MLETQSRWYIPAPQQLGWHVGFWNLVGALGFTLCGALGFASSNPACEIGLTWATFIGSWAFLVRLSLLYTTYVLPPSSLCFHFSVKFPPTFPFICSRSGRTLFFLCLVLHQYVVRETHVAKVTWAEHQYDHHRAITRLGDPSGKGDSAAPDCASREDKTGPCYHL